MSQKKYRNWIFCLMSGVLCVVLAFLPTEFMRQDASIAERVKVTVLTTDNAQLQPLGVVYSGAQQCRVRVASGPFKGLELDSVNFLNSDLEKDKLFSTGDSALAMLHIKKDRPTGATLIDHYRLDIQALLFALFALLLILFGGISGCGALISLVMSVLMVWKLLIPLLLRGFSPILCSLAVVVILTAMINLLVAGLSRTALVAILGSLLGTGITCALSFAFGNLLKVDGSSLAYVVPIIAQSNMQLELHEIFLSMVFISNSGALMDLGMDIASATEEIVRHCPDISRTKLLKSGFSMGKNMIGTMTTTLMLAYSGSYLSLLMYFAGQGTPVMDIINLRYVSSEVLVTLVGCFGLVTVAPFTALIASVLMRRGRAIQAADVQADLQYPTAPSN